MASSFLFELNVFHLAGSQASVSVADKLAIESSRRMAVDICRSMNDIVPKKGVEELSLIGLSVMCRAGQLLAQYDVGLCEGGLFTDEDVEALRRVQHDFTRRWRIGGKSADIFAQLVTIYSGYADNDFQRRTIILRCSRPIMEVICPLP